MKRTTRTDIHRPSAINVDEYEYVAFECIKIEGIGDCYALLEERARITAHMNRTGGTYANHEHGGNCMICGAWAVYTVLFYHELSNSYVRTGQDCASKLEMSYGSGFNAFKKAIADAREAVAGKKKAQALLADAGLSECWTVYVALPPVDACEYCKEIAAGKIENFWHTCKNNFPKEEQTIRDITGKLVKYGNISEPQKGLLAKLLVRIANRPAIEAARAAEREAAEDVPETSERITITGTVLTVRVDEGGQFGPTTKVLVRDERGFKLWGSRPAIKQGRDEHGNQEYSIAEKGDKISFSAVVERSDKDSKFGFFRRPTKGKMLQRAPEPVETVS